MSFLLVIFSVASAIEPKPKYTSKSAKTNAPERKATETKKEIKGALDDRLMGELNLVIGSPYRYADKGNYGFDCSGLVNKIYKDLFGIVLPRSARDIWKLGNAVDKNELQPGDLVFFAIRGSAVDHIGISIGARRFVHASRRKGVIISSLDDPYYVRRFVGAKRLKLKLKPTD